MSRGFGRSRIRVVRGCLRISIVALGMLVACSNGSTTDMDESGAQQGDQAPPQSSNPINPAPAGGAGQPGTVGAAGQSAMPATAGAAAGSGPEASQGGKPDQQPSDSDPGMAEPDSGGEPDQEPPTPAAVADYNEPGPYGPAMRLLNQAEGLVSGGASALLPGGNSNDPSAFTLFFPKGVEAGQKFPLLTFGNGTFCSPTFYDEFIGHVVSYGFIVIAPNTSNTGTGAEMLQGVDWALKQNEDPESPIYGKVDGEHIGAFGHSQGGAGTCRAGADARIDAIATLSGTAEIAQIQCPAFFVTSGGEAGSAPDDRIAQTLGDAAHPSLYGITVGGNHDEYTDKADEGITAAIGLTSNDGVQSRAAVTAWFDWQLKGKEEVRPLFLEKPCGFCNDENLQRLDAKGF